ncbi:hypothetical protein [Prescottella equi]|nr:hypothetical protein [Prescottella equi]
MTIQELYARMGREMPRGRRGKHRDDDQGRRIHVSIFLAPEVVAA